MRRQAVAVLVAVMLVPSSRAIAEGPPRPSRERLRAHVAKLASAEFAGRRGDGARKAEAYVTDAFRALALEPAFAGSFTQDIEGKEAGEVIGRNVAARIVGRDPKLKDEYVILSAHYDHLGTHDGKVYPGADDNASGVAMLLESARCFAEAAEKPRRSVLFVAFDLEENGLWGSRHFVEAPPVPLEQVKLFLTADMLGGALGGVCKDELFVLGTERAPGLRPWIIEASRGEPIKLGVVGSDLLVIDRSDYGPFRARQVPYLFFSSGESPRYHTPYDTPESLDYRKLEAGSRIMEAVVRKACDADVLPSWEQSTDAPLVEARTLRDVLKVLLEHSAQLQIKEAQTALLKGTVDQLDGIVTRGTFTPAERGRIVRVVQFILYTAL